MPRRARIRSGQGVYEVPEPIQSAGSNASLYDPSLDVCSEPSAPTSAATESRPPPPPPPPGVSKLLSDVQRAIAPGGQCLPEAGALAVTGGRMVASAAAMAVAAPTLIAEIPAVLAFIGNAVALAGSAALYANCRDDATTKAPTK